MLRLRAHVLRVAGEDIPLFLRHGTQRKIFCSAHVSNRTCNKGRCQKGAPTKKEKRFLLQGVQRAGVKARRTRKPFTQKPLAAPLFLSTALHTFHMRLAMLAAALCAAFPPKHPWLRAIPEHLAPVHPCQDEPSWPHV